MTDVVVPSLGESVTEAIVAAWLKQPGESVAVDEPLVELETDKATVEVGAPSAGVMAELMVAEGDTVEVGTVLAKLVAGATAAPSETAPASAPIAQPASPISAEPAGFDPGQVQRSGAGNQITGQDLRAFLGQDEPVGEVEGPAARKLLAEHGLAAAQVAASGPGGRVTKGDVLAHVANPAAQAAAATPAGATTDSGEERVRTPRIRQTIARRLKEAQNTAAILTTFNEVDMSAVMALRSRYKEPFEKKHGVRLGFTSFFAKAVVAAAAEVPAVNGRFEDNELVYNRYVHLGMAVSAPNGLMVPVIPHCESKSFAEIEAGLAELAGRARDGKLREDDMTGGTFTISNGGVFGSLLSTPILNRPQSGILGLHKIQDRPMAVEGEVKVLPMMYLALSYDHRLIDGREAVTFLVKVKESIEDPQSLLLDL
jgi:2-oxoglutarate dehydrogenase E2 component (dihydrolipoamide succinyltransferase)